MSELIERMIDFMEQMPGRFTGCYGDGTGGPCFPKCKRCILLADLKNSLRHLTSRRSRAAKACADWKD